MKKRLSYYSELCEERVADFTIKHQKEYKLDELKEIIILLKRTQGEKIEVVSNEYVTLLHDIFQFMPTHQRYFAPVDKDRMKLYFEKISELQDVLSIPEGCIEFNTEIKQKNKNLWNIVLPIFMICYYLFKRYYIFGYEVVDILFWILVFVHGNLKIVYFWKKHQWKKSYT